MVVYFGPPVASPSDVSGRIAVRTILGTTAIGVSQLSVDPPRFFTKRGEYENRLNRGLIGIVIGSHNRRGHIFLPYG
jgi:hypothetical protein